MKKIIVIAVLGILVGLGLVYFQLAQPLLAKFPVLAVTNSPMANQVLGETTGDPLLPVGSAPSPAASPEPELGRPQRLVIPKLNVDASVEHVGLDAQQRMDVPQQDENVGWYQYGPLPGDMGSAVLAGHYDTRAGGPAVFYELEKLTVGDEIQVYDEQGRVRTFIVSQTATYQDSTFPIDQVFGVANERRLNLITCAGVFDQTARNYQDRFVVYSVLQ